MPNVENLKQARRVIEAAPAHRLHMNVISEVADCGTAYCLAGWIAVDPWFRTNTRVGEIVLHPISLTIADVDAMDALDVVEDVLGLDKLDGHRLLARSSSFAMNKHAITKDEVIANIERLLEGLLAATYHAINPVMEMLAYQRAIGVDENDD